MNVYRNYYAKFLAIYEECYNDIVAMMQDKGITRIEGLEDEDYGFDRVTIRNTYYGNCEEKEVAIVGLVGDELYFENEEESVYNVKNCVEGYNITDLYDIVYRALYENNN